MPNNEASEIAPIGHCNFRNQKRKFGIKLDDRRRHVYVVGKTGVGKTTLLENVVISDLEAGRGVGIVDPHGEFAEKMLDFVPEERADDVIYFNPADTGYPIAFNPMERVSAEHRHLVASGLMGVFKKIWPDVWSARMEYILNNTLLSLLEFPSSTVLGIMRMLSEPPYRKKVVENLQDPVIKAFWVNEFSRYSQRLESEAVAAIQNKVGQFVSNPLVRNIMGQPHSTLNMRKIMDEGKIFIANLSKGKIGEDNSALLGSMLITRLNLAAMSRVDIREQERSDFFLYVDEFQNFATDSFANILSEARKYRLSLTLSHQYIGQLVHENSTKVRDAVFGNVGTIICFRIGAADAEFLEKEFMPEFTEQDLVNLAKAHIYIKLMIDGVASRPFSAETIPPQKPPLVSYKDEIIRMSREKYGTPKAAVEKKIASEWQGESDKVVEEKIVRRGERPAGDVLRGGDYVQGFRKRFDAAHRERFDAAHGERFGAAHGERRDFPPRDGRGHEGEGGGGGGYGEARGHEERRWREEPRRDFGVAPRPWPPREHLRPPQPPKRDVNIEDLRKAISESLQKNEAPQRGDSDLHEERPRVSPPPVRRKGELPSGPVEEVESAREDATTDEQTAKTPTKPFYVTDEDADETEETAEGASLEEMAEAEEKGEGAGFDDKE